jgi:hypothetical protein
MFTFSAFCVFQYMRRSTVRASEGNASSASKKLKMQPWSGVVTIILVEGMDLVPMDDNGLSDPYVKFRLGQEKYRSKVKKIKCKMDIRYIGCKTKTF